MRFLIGLQVFFITLILSVHSRAGEIRLAAAANFTVTAKTIISAFEKKTGHKVIASFGSTGKLYAQIVHGAPYDIFLAADTARPDRMIKDGHAVKNSGFTYAIGKLVIFTMEPDLDLFEGKVLLKGQFRRLAIANPKTAPYGVAALEVLKAMGVQNTLKSKLVYGENITQTYQFTATRAAQIGLVARSQVTAKSRGKFWVVPQQLYSPIHQGAVLLKKGEKNPAAKDFINFLSGIEARKIILKHGYDLK